MNKIILKPHIARKSRHFSLDDKTIPKELLTRNISFDNRILSDINLPLPSKKSDYVCSSESDGILWLGAKTGLTRIDAKAEYSFDKVMFFSCDRDLKDNNVKSVYAVKNGAWVLTDTAVTFIEMTVVTQEEVCRTLLCETLEYVDRQGMVSQKDLAVPGDVSSALHYGASDNDGGFTALFSIAEIFRYAVMKRDRGINAPETIEAKKTATRAVDACMLLMYIHGRGDGFVARTYIFDGEPVPDDGFFFKRNGNKAVCVKNKAAEECGFVGAVSDCSFPVPERLKYLYESKGKTLDDILYKADTSSDEITIQMLNMLFAHKYLACDDSELDDFIKDSVKRIVGFIIDNGFVLKDFHGNSTTWAKWNEEYFSSEEGHVDAALNSAEMLFLLKAVMEITGETGKWLDTYNYLIDKKGYADLTTKHYERLYEFSMNEDADMTELIMFGDHFLATASFFGLCFLEKDENLLNKYKAGYKSWRTSIEREHNPGYDFLYMIACPEESINDERVIEWFSRFNLSRIASSVSLVGRHDVPFKTLKHGYPQSSTLLPPDERFISKYDRDPLEYNNEDSGGMRVVESCFVYTFAYWIGRYFGFIG